MQKVVFSVVGTELRKVFIPQSDPKSVMNTFLTFSLLLTSYWNSFFNWIFRDSQYVVEYFWHSIYNLNRADIQSMSDLILTFNLLLTPNLHVAG